MTRKKEEEIDDNPESSKGIDKDDETLIRSALLEALENASGRINTTRSDDDDEDHIYDRDAAGEIRAYSPRPFLSLFTSGNDSLSLREGWGLREQRRNVLAVIQGLSKPMARRFFAALHTVVQSILTREEYLPQSAFQDEEDALESREDSDSTEHLQFLHYASQSVKAYLEGQALRRQKQSKLPSPATTPLSIVNEAFQVAQALHDILLSLTSAGPHAVETQSSILLLCESCWMQNLEYKERVVSQVVPLLVYAATHDESKSSVKRLYQMREAIATIEFRDESSKEVQGMLLKLASSPKILKQPEGTKLLVYLMQVDLILLRGFHRAMRVQIPQVRRSVLTIYGGCYFRAWKDAPSLEIRDSVETHVLYDLVQAVLYGANPNLVKALLVVLEPFHSDKKTPEVEKLLFRLYSGMLWRSLSTANGKIRVNATRVLELVFPLRDAPTVGTEVAIHRSCDALEALQQDPDPNVRIAASEAVARIVATYWDVLPPNEIRDFLNRIVLVQASDSTSSAVRVAAVNAVATILDASQSHAVLRALLPLVGNLIHDRVERVRLAVVRLLLKVKGLPGIKYYHVVPVNHLTSRLAAEGHLHPTGPVASSLTALMVNSFCPHGPSTRPETQLTRTVKFLKSDMAAANVFYKNLAQHVPVRVVDTLSANLFRCVIATIDRAANNTTFTDEGRDARDSDDVDSAKVVDQELVSATDVALMASIVETASVLWHSIDKQLSKPVNGERAQLLLETFTGSAIAVVLSYLDGLDLNDEGDTNPTGADCSNRLTSALLGCARLLPPDTADDLHTYLFDRLSTASGQESISTNISPHLAVLCLWGSTDEVAEAIASSIESSFAADFSLNFGSPEGGSRKRKSSRGKGNGKVSSPIELSPCVALQVLSDFLQGSDATALAAREAIFGSTAACDSIERALLRGTKYAERILKFEGIRSFGTSVTEAELEFILATCESLGRFQLHRDAFNGDALLDVPHSKALLQWTSENVIPVLLGHPIEEDAPFVDPNLSRISLETSTFGVVNSPIPTGPSRRRSNRNKSPMKLTSISSTSSILSSSTPQASPAARDLAIALLHSCLNLLSEQAAVTGLPIDGLVGSVDAWTDVLELHMDDLQVDLLVAAFGRLAFVLCKQDEFSLLQSLIVKSGEMEDDSDVHPVGAVIAKLLATRSPNNVVPSTIRSVLDAVSTFIGGSKNEVKTTPGPSLSLEDLWLENKGCVRSALRAVLSSSSGTLELAKQIVKTLEQPLGVEQEVLLGFYGNCLVLLCNDDATKSSPEVVQLVRGLDLGTNEMPASLRTIVGQLKVGLA